MMNYNESRQNPGNLAAVFARTSNLPRDKVMMKSGADILTYGLLHHRVTRLLRLYRDSGLRRGDRVILATGDSVDTVVIFFSLLAEGLTVVIIDPQSPGPRARGIISAADPHGLIIDAELERDWQFEGPKFVLPVRRSPRRGIKLLKKFSSSQDRAEAAPFTYPEVLNTLDPVEFREDIPPEHSAVIMFTSGTTSRPKGVELTHSNLVYHMETLSRQFDYNGESRILNVLPHHHVDGIFQGALAAMFNGAALYRPFPFTLPNIGPLLDSIYSDRISHFVSVPTMLRLILTFGREFKDNFESEDFRFVISAADQLDERLWLDFQSTFNVRVANMYGLTETVTGGLFSGPGDGDHCVGTVGRPVDCEARLVDENGKELGDEQPGELLLRGGNIMKGYFRDPEATAIALAGGWLHTGDLAIRDARGFFRIVGRKKNIIISGGINVNPREVTEVLLLHPEVREVHTLGVADEIWGEQVVCAVVPLPGSGVTERDLVGFCREHLPPTRIPHRVYLFGSLPRGAAGKVISHKVRQMVRDRWENGSAQDPGDLRSRLYKIAAGCFHVPIAEIVPGSNLDNTPGWDSLAHFVFVARLEKDFCIHLNPREIMGIDSIQRAEEIVTQKRGAE